MSKLHKFTLEFDPSKEPVPASNMKSSLLRIAETQTELSKNYFFKQWKSADYLSKLKTGINKMIHGFFPLKLWIIFCLELHLYFHKYMSIFNTIDSCRNKEFFVTMHCGQKQWLNPKSQIMPFKVKAFYELPIFTLRNKAETQRKKASCQKIIHPVGWVKLSKYLFQTLHISDRPRYHFLEEKSLKPAVNESNTYSGIHVKLSPVFEPALF